MNKNVTANNAVTPKRRKAASLDKRKAKAGWWFIMPFLVVFVVVYLPMVIDSLRFSFSDLNFTKGGGYTTTFVGLKNYHEALAADAEFTEILVTGIKQLVFDIPAIVIFSLFMAVLLNQKMFGRAMFRAIFFIPVIISTGVIEYVDQSNAMLTYMTDSSSAVDDGSGAMSASESLAAAANLDWLFGSMKVGGGLVKYVVDIIANVYDIITRSGVQMLIFLAGLQSISPAIYESCQIDGAAAWETFWKITFPMISPMILVNTIYTVIDSFTRSTNSVMIYIDKIYAKPDGTTLSSAMSWVYFLFVIVIIGIFAFAISKYVFYQRRD
ncbi:MAG: sugar ABC transporter permease [Ruminococcaceae bacterium]|nr:sugar ABC transporter permease [Oscillospiraceae bacterium]